MTKYEVTIGFPVYNVEKYLRKTMESALSQIFESIEYLICDDCGTDSSISIVEEYQQKHQRGKDIHIVHQPQKHRKEICQKPCYTERCEKLMMYYNSFVCQILAHRTDSDPCYTNLEIRNIMRHPMSLLEILHPKRARLKNLQSWIFGVLPPVLSVALLKLVGKVTHRILGS